MYFTRYFTLLLLLCTVELNAQDLNNSLSIAAEIL